MWRKLLLTSLVLTFAFSSVFSAGVDQIKAMENALARFDAGQNITQNEKNLISDVIASRENSIQENLIMESRQNYAGTTNLRSVLAEGFEGTFPPAGWSIINDGDANGWVLTTSGGHDAAKAAKISYGATAHDDWLVTPKLEIVTGDSIILWAKNGSSTWTEEFNVMLSTTGNAKADFVVTLAAAVGPGTVYERLAYDLTTYAGSNVYVAFQAISTDKLALYIDDVSGPEVYVAPEPPVAAADPIPEDAATGVTLDQILSWAPAYTATGYTLSFGTDNPPTNIENARDLGDVLTYTPGALTYGTTYYWSVTPYNAYGDATGVPVWSFIAMDDPAIVAFPHMEGFEDTWPPAGWSVLNNNGDTDAWVQNTSTSYVKSGTKSAKIYTDYNASNDDWLITPAIDLSGTAKRLKFWTRAASSSEPDEVQVLLSSATSDVADFTVTLLPSTPINFTTFAEYTLDLSAYSSDVYIAFVRNQAPADGWNLYLDDITIEEIPLTGEMTLAPASIEQEVVIGESADVTLTITNAGAGDLTVSGIVAEAYTPGASVLNEGFEGTQTGWTVLNENADTDMWNFDYAYNPHSGSQSATINTDYNAGANDDYLITPLLALTGNQSLSYWYRVQSLGEPNDFEVLLSTTGISAADFTTVLLPLASYSNTTYMEQVIDLSAYSSDSYIAFHIPSGGLDGWRLYIDDVSVEAAGSWDTATWISANPTTTTVGASGSQDIIVTLTAPATEGESIGRLIITSDDLGVADTETLIDVTLDAIGPVAPTGLAALAADDAVELIWDDPNPTLSRYLSGELSYEKLANAVISLKDKTNLTTEDKLLLESYHYSTTIAQDAFDGSEASTQEMHELMLRSFDGYNVYRRDAGATTWGPALAMSVPGFTYSDVSVANGTTYEYALSASFTAGESALSDSVMATPTAVVLLPYASDFETDDGGFNASGDWAWGSPDPIADGPDTARSGLNLWGTVLDGDYPANSWSWLTLPFDISGLENSAIVSFYMWHELETNWDYGKVGIDHDNDGEFNILRTYTGNSPGWVHESIIIPDSLMSDYAVFGFLLDSDGSSQRAGLYIDDFSIEANVTPILVLNPATLEATLESGSADDQMLNLANAGGGFLDYYLSVEYPDTAINYLLGEDFETGLGAFTDESAGAWATSTTIFHGGAQSVVDVYGLDADDVLVTSAPIDLARIPNAVLGFWQIPYLEGSSWDNGFVEASTDGGLTWVELAAYNKYDCTPVPTSASVLTNEAWIYSEIDLSMYGNQVVSIRFRLESDGSVLYAGWALDDIEVFSAPNWLDLGMVMGSIPGGENVDAPVHFNSLGVPLGVHAAEVMITSNLEESPHFIPVTMTVDAASAPLIVVMPDSFGFGHVFIEEPAPPIDVTVYNAGFGTTTNMQSVAISGTDAAEFMLNDLNTYPVDLPGDGMTERYFSVAFAPTSEGEKTATLLVTNGVTREVMEFPLTGSADFLPFGTPPMDLVGIAFDATVNLSWLPPLVIETGWISYHDGTFENGYSSTDGGAGIASLFTPLAYPAIVEQVQFHTGSGDFPNQEIQVFILADDGATVLAGPYTVNGVLDDWITVDNDDVTIESGGFMVATYNTLAGGPYVDVDEDTYMGNLYFGSHTGGFTEMSAYSIYAVGSHEAYVNYDGEPLLVSADLDNSDYPVVMGTPSRANTPASVHPAATTINTNRSRFSQGSSANAMRDLLGYNVYRGMEAGDLEFLAVTTDTFYVDMAVTNRTTYYYEITAIYDEGESIPSNMAAATPLAAASMPYFSDLEADDGGFFSMDDWQWGVPDFSDGPDTAFSLVNVWGTALEGDYLAYANEWLTQPFNLSGATGSVVLNFAAWAELESGWDYGIVAIDHDNDGLFTPLAEYTGNTGDWVQEMIVVPDSLISDYAILAFILQSDGSGQRAGVYLDDISVMDVLLPELALTVEADFGVDLAFGEMSGSDDFTMLNTGVAGLDYTLQYEVAAGRVSGLRDISGAYAYSTTWPVTPGTTFNMSIYVQNASIDYEWVDSASVTFPAGVTINDMTPLTVVGGTRELEASGISADGLYAGWGYADGPANIYSTNLAMATINVTIDAGFTGDLSFDWFINGEIYGSEPHTAAGTFVFMAPAVEVAITPMGGTIAPAGSALITSSVTVNSYEVGFYPGFITFTSNDPRMPEGMIPFNVSLAPASGILDGTITSSYDNSGMQDVEITAVETATLQEHYTMSGANGSYAMELPIGNYDVTMSYDEYDTEVENVEITLNTTTTLDMAMSPNVLAPMDLVAEEVAGGFAHLSWGMPGPDTQLIAYHDGSAASAFYQNMGQGYGVVFDISAYAGATIEMADFVHYGWGITGLFDYNLHIIDWTDFSTVNVISGLSTSADAADAPQLEEGIELGSLSGLTLVGIFIEPLSGLTDDAYPEVMTDATAPALAGSSYIIDLAAIDASYDISVGNPTSGDFMVNLWIHVPDGSLAQAPVLGDGRIIHDSTPSLRIEPTRDAVSGWPTIGLPVADSALRSELLFFKVYSSVDAGEWTMIGASNSQEYVDESTQASQSIEYKVTAQYDIAESDFSNVVQLQIVGVDALGLPDTYALEQNYPNPFNPITFINYQLPEATYVKILIYNVLGQKVATLVDQPMNAGYYNISWSGLNQYGSPVSSGVYLYRIETEGFSAVRKLMYLK